MLNNEKIRPAWIVIVMLIVSGIIFLFAYFTNTNPANSEGKPKPKNPLTSFSEFKNSKENENCLKCHGQSKYSYDNKESNKKVAKRMYVELIIDRSMFYMSNHRKFKCIDCHSEDYMTFPHDGNLRMQAKPNCLDCHGGDEQYAKYHFENIEKEFQESVHSEKHSDEFTCWMCHNAHTYEITARPNENIKQTVAYDNAICLSCHGDILKYQLLTDKQNPNLISKHEWLPNQALHFQSVRCIECHTKKINDSTLVAHKILPKKEALRKCNECHSSNSVLLTTLYKYKAKEVRSARGLMKAVISNDTYAIGANRNFYLNRISIFLFGLILFGIFIHAFFRIIKK
jgi:hypothetical protein